MDRVLVIDDELDICLMLTRHLRNQHFEAHYALTVKEACQKVSSMNYELLFIDLNLPDGSGFDVIKYIKELNLNPIMIVVSAYDSEANKAIEMGASLFISKPFAIKTINEALKALNFLAL